MYTKHANKLAHLAEADQYNLFEQNKRQWEDELPQQEREELYNLIAQEERKYFEKSETDNKTQDNYQLSDDEYIELLKKHPGGITQKDIFNAVKKRNKALQKQEQQENFQKKLDHAKKKMKNMNKTITGHVQRHQKSYKQARDVIVKLVLIFSALTMLFALVFNYITFYKTLVAVSPGLSKFYYAWALLTYTLYIVGGVLWSDAGTRETFFLHPYLFWFISFASLVLMITSFVVEAIVVSEIKEEPKRKSVQICVLLDMVFGIILCVLGVYLSYKMYGCQERYLLECQQ